MSRFRFVVVPHTHWDREWYLPFERFRLRLGEVVDDVLDVLERDRSFSSFTLDGQAIVLEDYVDVRPLREPQLRALLAAGRLEAGPSYVLPDELLVGGECLVRNLLLGRDVCRCFGVEPSRAGYLPDSFGHPAQLPQLLAGFGIRVLLFSRGLGDELDEVGVVFRWQAPDGSEVVAAQLLPHYDGFAELRSAADGRARVDAIVDRFGAALERAGCRTIALGNGSDHLPVQPELPRLVAELGPAFALGTFADVADELAALPGLPAFTGELVGGRLQNVLRGVNSARLYLKQANARAERRLLSVEALLALASLRDGSPFPAADVRVAWRDLLRNQPHDSVCGCSCDEVHRDMLVRFEQLDRTLDALEQRVLGDGDELVVVNPLPYRRARLVSRDGGEALVELDGFAAQPLRLEPVAAAEPAHGRSIANGLLSVEAADDGTLTIADLRHGRRLSGLHVLEDEPDLGDLYTFCPDETATPWRSGRADVHVLRAGPLVWELSVAVDAPCGPVRTVARLVAGGDRVELTTTVRNRAGDHRLRVAFPLEDPPSEVRAESQFAVARRFAGPPVERTDWVEPPARTAETLGAVALGPLVLLTKGLPEYEAGPGGLRLTLLRCVGTISRGPGLPTRPVAAGPDVATPDGQCPGVHVFEYALRLDGDRLGDAALIRASQDYRFDFVTGHGARAAPPPLALGGDVVFGCLKGAEDADGVVLRVFNPAAAPATAVLGAGVAARRLRLDETGETALPGGGLVLGPGEIATLRLAAS